MIAGTLVNLRAQELSDLENNYRWVNDREVTRHLAVRYQMSTAAEETWMRGRTTQMMAFGDVTFAIETKEGRHIGNCGLHNASAENRSASLGITIGEKDCWSQGYGSDAVRTMMRFGFEEMNLNRVDLLVYEFNERAIAAYRKCGFEEEGRLRDAHYGDGAYCDVVLMAALQVQRGQEISP